MYKPGIKSWLMLTMAIAALPVFILIVWPV
jgi:hypothetical protein